MIWMGPYKVDIVFPNGTVRLITIDGSNTQLLANGHLLRLYQRPLSKEEFTSRCTTDTTYQFLKGKEIYPSPSEP
jgi:hypothetical protein